MLSPSIHGRPDTAGKPWNGQIVELVIFDERKLSDLAVPESDGGELIVAEPATVKEEQHLVTVVGVGRPVDC